ncbi:MAG TPA: phosphatidate cytidylyltransferase [Synergistaceae bacterium]|nr:phosphatidate cytidylyltransferase [Synergistaceae bacterium]
MAKPDNFLSSIPDLPLRAFSSIFIVLIILGGILKGGPVWNAIVFVVAMISLWEFYKLLSAKHDISPWLIMVSGAFILIGASSEMSLTAILCSISSIVFVALFLEIIRRQVSAESFALENMGATIVGIAYVILPWSFMILIRSRELGSLFLIILFLCTWSCDVAAYIVGSRLGRNLMCEKISPKKTWEGFFGGAAASLLCGGLLAVIFSFPPLPLLLMGLLCGVAGQLGDLGESVLKREAGVKDTGSLIPGHGGLLDRFDSILVNGTLAFVIFELIG